MENRRSRSLGRCDHVHHARTNCRPKPTKKIRSRQIREGACDAFGPRLNVHFGLIETKARYYVIHDGPPKAPATTSAGRIHQGGGRALTLFARKHDATGKAGNRPPICSAIGGGPVRHSSGNQLPRKECETDLFGTGCFGVVARSNLIRCGFENTGRSRGGRARNWVFELFARNQG